MTLALPRRRFLSLLAAPLVVSAGSLMPIRALPGDPKQWGYWGCTEPGEEKYTVSGYLPGYCRPYRVGETVFNGGQQFRIHSVWRVE